MLKAREKFLQRFNSSLITEIIEYGKRLTKLSEEENVVLVFMARKAVCLADSLAKLNLTTFSSPVTSERTLDQNIDWLKKKRIIIVDDALISGTSLYNTNQKLLEAGIPPEKIDNVVLCVNKKWWSQDLINPSPPFLTLEDGETSSLCASIVEAISLIPRPYSVDFPLYRDVRIPSNRLDEFVVIPGWTIDNVTSPLQSKHEIVSLTLTPHEKTLVELDKRLGWNFSENALVKIRLYGEALKTGRPIFWCNILPIVAIKPIPTMVVDALFTSLLQRCSVKFPNAKKYFDANHLNEVNRKTAEMKSKLRLISFVAANYLAEHWLATAIPGRPLNNNRKLIFMLAQIALGGK